MLKFLRQTGSAVLLLFCCCYSLAAQSTDRAAIEHLRQKLSGQNWSTEDLATLRLKSRHRSANSGLTHCYFQQERDGIPILASWASIHLDDDGSVFKENLQLIGQLDERLPSPDPILSAEDALQRALGKVSNGQQVATQSEMTKSKQSSLTYTFPNGQWHTVTPNLVYQKDQAGDLHLCWHFLMPADDDLWDVCVDAKTGEEISFFNQVSHCQFSPTNCNDKNHLKHYPQELEEAEAFCSRGNAAAFSANGTYRVFPMSVESPIYGTRSLIDGVDLIDTIASPFGWHDTSAVLPSPNFTHTQGNNVYAYYAQLPTTPYDPSPSAITRVAGLYVGGNVPDEPDLHFDYSNSFHASVGTAFVEDAVTNLFVWNNLCHDVFYRYGFDEAAGNFQAANLTGQGIGGDYVRARAQDASGVNNATFFSPPEPNSPNGNPPYMRMFLWDTAMPDSIIDGDFDNAIIAHEYGHGVTSRLVGGAFTNACFTNFEHGSEGWSDFFGLMLTMHDHDGSGVIEKYKLGEGIRGIAAYVLGDTANALGVRPAYYSHNMDCWTAQCNDYTYGDLTNVAQPHGTGFIWCTMLWDMALSLMDTFGYDSNIYNVATDVALHKGNTRALNLVIEGLKLTPCNPSFPQMRDAILEADTAIYGAVNSPILWEVFARRGLGFSATAGGNEAFDSPTLQVTKTVDTTMARLGDQIDYQITVKNNSSDSLTNVNISDPIPPNLNVTSISDGGSVQNGMVVFPALPVLPKGQSVIRTFSGEVVGYNWTDSLYNNPIEVLSPPDFTPAGDWITDQGVPLNPHTGSTRYWWHSDLNVPSEASLILTLDLDSNKNNHLAFWQYYDTEPGFDGGVIEVSVGADWVDLGPRIKQNGYNTIIFDDLPTPIGVPVKYTPLSRRRAFSGYSGGYVQTIVDLTGYHDSTQIRFRYASDEAKLIGPGQTGCDPTFAACDGWYLDDFVLYDLKHIQNTAYAISGEGFSGEGNVGEIGTVFFRRPCKDTLTISTLQTIGIYEARQLIQTSGPVKAMGLTLFNAPSVELYPEFEVTGGKVFETLNTGCN